MAKYIVSYQMKKGNSSTSGSKTVECETEMTAIQSAESQAKSQHPGYDFILKKVEKR